MSARTRQQDIPYMNDVDAAFFNRGHGLAYVLSALIAILFAAFVAWAHFAVLDEVTRGTGQVIPSQRIQVIQNLEGGILENILVNENQIVNKGDILVRISNEMAASMFRDAEAKAMEHKAAVARLQAEIEGGPIVFPEEITDTQLIEDQKAIYATKTKQLDTEIRVLDSQYRQKRQEIKEMTDRKQQLAQSLKIAREQRDIAKPLMQKNLYPKVDYLSLERDVLSLEGEIKSLSSSIPRVREAAAEAKQRIAGKKAEFASAAQDEINRRRVELRSLIETLSAGRDRVTRTEVRSPVRGTIKQIIISTQGGVIRPGEPIMEIVPLDDTLLVEANIRPADIAFLHPGQKAMVKISAYDFSIYGGLPAKVEQISADTIQNAKEESFYKVKLRTESNAIVYRGDKLPIIPGMTATVDILTGHKSVLDYLLKPILKAKQNALRER
ncbi:HlyD family type I secretion periplasmic adaptor subunit [Desulfoplanes sp.]